MKYILGTKVGMVQLYEANGNAIACTVVHAEPNVVLENKKTGIKIGYKDVKENKVNKAHKGVFKKVNQDLKKYVRTFSGIEGSYNVGDKITVDTFTAGQYVDVQGTSKGHGFTGAIKRWNFKIGPLSHGAGYPHRYQGSLAFGRGGSAPQRVYKGKKMHGHWGHDTITAQNLTIVKIMPEENLIIISGAIPGPEGSLVTIKTSVKKGHLNKEYNIVTKQIMKAIEQENLQLEDKELVQELNEQVDAQVAVEEAIESKAKEEKAAEQHAEKIALEEGENK